MRIEAIIEKGSDGLFSVRSEVKVGDSYLGGFGESTKVAKADFMESVAEAFEESGQSLEGVSVVYTYDVPSFFNAFDYINASKFAAYAGINESKMRQYKAGVSYPNEKTMKKIMDAAHKIGEELLSLSL